MLMELKTVSTWPAVSKIHVPPLAAVLWVTLEPFRLWEGSDGDPGVGMGDLGNGAGERPVGEFALRAGSPQADRDTAAGPRRATPPAFLL